MSTKAQRQRAWEEYGFDYAYEVTVLHHTFKAMLVRDERGREFWVPFSALQREYSEVPRQGRGMLVVKLWFAKARRWVDWSLCPEQDEERWQQ